MRALVLALCLLPAASALAAEPPAEPEPLPTSRWVLRNRLSATLMGSVAQTGGEGDLELILSERLRWRALDRPDLLVEVRAAGRGGVRFDDLRPSRIRVRELGVHIEKPRWALDLGRTALAPGVPRLVDGVRFVARTGRGVELGGWAGLSPDPYTTAPALRFGGGPIVRWTHDKAQASAVAEVLGTPTGLDRAALVLSGRLAPERRFEVSGRLDLQFGGPAGPVAPAELRVDVRGLPLPDLSLHGWYDLYGAWAYLRTADLDPAVARWQERAGVLEADPAHATDATLYHAVGGRVRWTPRLGEAGARLFLGLDGRWRHHELVDRRSGQIRARGGVTGLLGGRLDLVAVGGAVGYGAAPAGELGLTAALQPDKAGRLLLDGSAFLGLEPRKDGLAALLDADLYLGVTLPAGFGLSVGYRYSTEPDGNGWSSNHGGMLRASWSLRVPRHRAGPSAQEPQE